MMAVSQLWMSGSTLCIKTDDASTSVEVRQVGSNVVVNEVGTSRTWNYSASNVGRLQFQGGAGNDRFVNLLTNTPVHGWGYGGNDYLEGYNGADFFDGGDGDDTLVGFGGNDQLYGGNGNDTIRGGSGNDELVGQAGNDQLRGDSGDDRIWGGSGNDVLLGGDGNDQLVGEDGNDRLNGQLVTITLGVATAMIS